MVRQIPLKPSVEADLRGRIPAARLWAPLLAFFLMLATLSDLKAESPAAKNNEGNRLFSQEKYEDAEKAYLEAQVKSPGRPEILYNLGNSLIKQKKYDQGIQALRQSISEGDAGIKENSWFNAGNALYRMGNFKDSAEAYIQALRLDPKDRDAKHNLEMALRQLEQQQQAQSDKSRNQQGTDSRSPQQSESGNKGETPQDNRDSENSGNREKDKEPGNPPAAGNPQSRNSIEREQALQILDAVQSRELEEQRRLLEHRERRKSSEKDW
jgi:Ca-activated chloride channel family protein